MPRTGSAFLFMLAIVSLATVAPSSGWAQGGQSSSLITLKATSALSGRRMGPRLPSRPAARETMIST